MNRSFGVVAGALALAALATSCGAAEKSTSERGSDSGGACALSVRYQGRTYSGVAVEVAPREGRRVGTAVLPGCDDTDEGEEASADITVARLPGASPKRALVWVGRHDVVLVRDDLKPEPTAVTRLFDAPRCDVRDEPISLFGTWLGILQPDGNTETDLVPPYDIRLMVNAASAQRYERAELTVRVPGRLGEPPAQEPLSKGDVAESLWEGGDIEVEAICDGGRYVAKRVEAHPPE